MRGLSGRLVQVALAAMLGLVGLTGLSLAGVGVPSAAAETVRAVQTLGSCLNGRRAGDLVMLFDKSGSIETNDPDNARIVAAKELLRQLSADAQRRGTDLQVRIAGFSHTYEPAGDWTSLKDPGAAEALGGAVDAATTTNAFESDYWAGLDGARRELHQRPNRKEGRCQALLWFTDGQFNLSRRDDPAELERFGRTKEYAPGVPLVEGNDVRRAEELGKTDLCRTTGPANQLRADGVTLLGIGLGTGIAFELMQRITENADGSCGSLRQPPGKFWQVENFDQVLEAFDEVAHPAATETRAFVLDDLLTDVHAFARVPDRRLTYVLKSPDGQELELRKGRKAGKLGAADVRWEWFEGRALVVDLERARQPSWAGRWEIVISDETGQQAGSNPRVSFRGDLYPAWPDNAPGLVSGATADVPLGLARADGRPLPVADVPGELVMRGELTDANRKTHRVLDEFSKADLINPVKLTLAGVQPGPARLRLSLTYTTAAVNGLSTKLEAQDTTVDVKVLPPPDRGSLAPTTLDFGTVVGPADATASIAVTGPSCVWLDGDPTVLGSPAGVEPVFDSPHRSPDSCLRVDLGATAELPVQLTSTEQGNGALVGTVPVHLAPRDDPGRALVQTVDFSVIMEKEVDITVAIGAFVAAMVAGIGIPVAGLYLAKYLTAKIPGRALEAIRVPLSVTGDAVSTGGRPLSLETLPPAVPVDVLRKGSRQVSAAGVDLRTRTGLSPFASGWVDASLPAARGVTSTHDRPSGPRAAARLPLAVHNTWALFHDPAGLADQATLLLLRGLDVTDTERRDLVEEARRQVPRLLRGLRPEVPGGPVGPAGSAATDGPAGPGSGPGGWGGGSFGGPEPSSPVGSTAGAGWSHPAPPPTTQPPSSPLERPQGAGAATDGPQQANPRGADDTAQQPIDWSSSGFGSWPPTDPDVPPGRP